MTTTVPARTNPEQYRGFDPKAEALIAEATALRPLLQRNAAEAERAGHLLEENIQALDALNLTALTLPARLGGLEASLTTACRVLEELAKGDASTAWVTMIQFHATQSIIGAPEAVQQDIFTSPVKRVSALGAGPGSFAERADGGWRLTGRSGFATGSAHADWVILLVTPVVQDGQMVGFLDAYLPLKDVLIEHTWEVAGMSATGSNTVVLDRQLVAEDYVRYNDMRAFAALRHAEPGPSAADNLPFVPVLILSQLAVGLGAAEAMLDLVVARAPRRAITRTVFAAQTESHVAVHHIAEAALKIQGVRAMLLAATAEADGWALRGQPMPYADRARIRGLGGYAMAVLRDAADTLLSAGGASGFALADPLQRHWRDLNTLSRHALTATAVSIEAYGRALLEVEPNVTEML